MLNLLGIVAAAWLFQRQVMPLLFTRLEEHYRKKNLTLTSGILEQVEKPVRHLFLTLCILFAGTYAYDISLFDHLFLTRILHSLVIFYVLKAIYNIGGYIGEHTADLTTKLNVNLEKSLFPFFSRVFKVVIMILGLGLIAHEWGYYVGGLITGLGISGLAVALGARDMLAHIFGGIAIAFDKPFSMGDWISIESGKVEGIVEDMSFRSTRIRSFDKAVVSIPNAVLANQYIFNWSRRQNRRVRFHLDLPYDTAVHTVERLIARLQQTIQSHSGVERDSVIISFETFEKGTIHILVEFLTSTPEFNEFLRIQQDVNLLILQIVAEEDIKLAFPSQSIYLEKQSTTT